MLGKKKSVKNQAKVRGNNKLIMNPKMVCASISLLLIVIVSGISFMLFYDFRSDSNSKIQATPKADEILNLEGRYYRLNKEERVYHEFVANSKDKTTGEFVTKRKSDDEVLYSNDYRIQNEKIIVDEYEYEDVYTVFKNYLVLEKFTFEGIIPKGKTFDANCTYSYDNAKIIFNIDGTIERFFEFEYETDSGTYERKGDIITCEIEGEEKVVKYLIFNNQVNDIAYYKEEE